MPLSMPLRKIQVALTIIFGIVTINKAKNLDSNQTENGVNVLSNDIENDINEDPQCIKEACVRKCCPIGVILEDGKCVPKKNKLNFLVYTNSIDGRRPVEGFNVTEDFNVLFGFDNCSEELNETRMLFKKMNISTDGKLYVHIPNNIPKVIFCPPDMYCINSFISEIGYQKPQLIVPICVISKQDHRNYRLSSSCMLISCFFILLTVAVYAWLPELRNLHGMVLMAYLLCFFVGFLFLGTMQILILRVENTTNVCICLTFIIYFFVLAAFFWLNVMCYDIWRTISGKRAHSPERSTMKRFLLHYAIYAFGVPTAMTTIMAVLEFTELPIPHLLLPKLRIQGCFLYGDSKLLYLYGPIVILCVANMTFFTMTAFKIWKTKKETNKALHNKDSSTNHHNRKDTQRFTLYIKLFTVMGINWILEVLSSFYPDADIFWQFSDTYNGLVGLTIFIIFVCKKKTLNLIKKRIKNIQRSNADIRGLKNITNQNINPSNTQRNASLNTVQTFISAATDSRKSKTNDAKSLEL